MLAPVDEGTELNMAATIPTRKHGWEMRCETENFYAWPRPLLDTRTRFDGIAVRRRANIAAKHSAKRLRPQPAGDAKIIPGLAGACSARAVLECVALSSAERSQRLLHCVIGPVLAVPGNLQLPSPLWLHQSHSWSNAVAPVWRPGNGPRPGRQMVKPHSCSALNWLQNWCPPGRSQIRSTCRVLDCTYTTCAVPCVRGRWQCHEHGGLEQKCRRRRHKAAKG